jgi:signal transduction histidine kinase
LWRATPRCGNSRCTTGALAGSALTTEEWTPNLAAARAGLAGIGAISVVDRDGIIRRSTRREIVGDSRADNYVVREALKGPADRLVVGTPFRAVVEPFSYLIPIARSLTSRDGSIEGAVVASFVPADLGRFFQSLDIELRTPLTAIAGWARMLVDGMVSDSSRDGALQSIERNAQTQTRLIEDLLDVSSGMTGKLRLHVRTVEVLETVRAAIEAIAPAAAAKSITIDTSLDSSAGSITGDPERLQQIVWNLLSNAVKFTPPGGYVNVAVAKIENEVSITVNDTGAGITPEFLPHVFEHFRQADSGPTRRHGGLGLGLAIVRSLTELHGGSVTAQSDGENKGATFTVRLPAPIRQRV